MKSTHEALVNQVERIETHPNADLLELIYVDNYCCAVRKGDFKLGDKFVFIVPDTVVDGSREEFSFLGEGTHRIKVKKLRGIISQGLIIPTEFEVGVDCWDILGLERYEPELKLSGGEDTFGPSVQKYDIDAINKYVRLMEGEVVATEKVHGANARYMFKDELYVGSRTNWKKQGNSHWWTALTENMKNLVQNNPDWVLYGEVFGNVQDMKYNRSGVEFIAFDIMKPDGMYLEHDKFVSLCQEYEIPTVPEIYRGKFDYELLKELAEEPSKLYNGGKEGLVVKSIPEVYNPRYGRNCYKIVSNWYYTKGSK